jgi:uncharacterized Zn-binding protein involved in type VI secretion
MAAPAIVMSDQITGQCMTHLIPNPATGIPQPAPPMPFSAPLTIGLSTKVFIHKKAAAVVGSQGLNTPPHIGLHPSDPYMVPAMEIGKVVSGSTKVFFGGQPAATAQSQVTCCVAPGQLVPTVTDVLIG